MHSTIDDCVRVYAQWSIQVLCIVVIVVAHVVTVDCVRLIHWYLVCVIFSFEKFVIVATAASMSYLGFFVLRLDSRRVCICVLLVVVNVVAVFVVIEDADWSLTPTTPTTFVFLCMCKLSYVSSSCSCLID
ncbi:hypothetical protein BpHYR1_036814 [Brachionus plicatilis]|uniref:Uncharacterized protein n=1 Tax=Brachionus plicatilis TaxID=10195 RepID=A0A3M7SHF1_BRAPC|nr:hypothetical protein BpHYR1_036814 [Brachionus plicatilis]